MKKTVWLTLILMLLCVFALSACDTADTPPNNGQQTTDGKDDNHSSDTPTVCQHTFGDWTTVKQATCKEEGTLARTCSKCSETEEESIQKSETHTPVTDAAIPATCKDTGLTEGSHCSVCNKVFVEQTTVPSTYNHTFVRQDYYQPPKCSQCELEVIRCGNADGSISGGNNNVKYFVTGDLENYRNFEIVIYGKGAMPNFSETNPPVWCDYLSSAVKITIGEGITSIGSYAFYCPDSISLCNFVMSDTVKTIKPCAISLNIRNLVLGNGVEVVESYGFSNVDSVYIPKSVKKLYIGNFGNEFYFYEGALEEFYQIKLYVWNRSITVKEYIATLDDHMKYSIHIYVQAKDISDMSHHWRQPTA